MTHDTDVTDAVDGSDEPDEQGKGVPTRWLLLAAAVVLAAIIAVVLVTGDDPAVDPLAPDGTEEPADQDAADPDIDDPDAADRDGAEPDPLAEFEDEELRHWLLEGIWLPDDASEVSFSLRRDRVAIVDTAYDTATSPQDLVEEYPDRLEDAGWEVEMGARDEQTTIWIEREDRGGTVTIRPGDGDGSRIRIILSGAP